MRFRKPYAIILAFCFCSLPFAKAYAILDIQITEGVVGEIPVAVVPFVFVGNATPPSEDVSDIVVADLSRTGRFTMTPEKDFLERPSHGGEVNFDNWRAMGVENLVVGQVKPAPNGNFLIRFQLFDVFKRSPATSGPGEPEYKYKQIAGYNLPAGKQQLRRAAHFISDIIYEKLTGERGAFNTQVAYITAANKNPKEAEYSLQVADADGHNPFTILRSSLPIMSPSWSPNAKKLAYVSFENRKSAIYIQDMASGTRKRVSFHKGINGAPSWSPDGKQLAMTRSHSGNVEIHVLDLASGKDTQLTRNRAIDTEPVWSPDGKSIIFTSDRSGKPQLYSMSSRGGRPERLTFEGDYNTRAAFSPDGKKIAMVHREEGGYRIAVQDLTTGNLQVLTDGRLDESPSFAPNGSMILYATEHDRKGVLAAVSVDGRVRQRLVLQLGDVREPAWSPYSSK